MKVYYGKNFYYKGEKKIPLQKIRLDQSFQWEEKRGVIFALYVGEEGVAVDIGLETPRQEVAEFIAWYEQNWSGKEDSISHNDHEEIEARSPLHTSYRMKIAINENNLETDFSCTVTYYNQEMMNEFHAHSVEESIEEQMISEYGCDKQNGWQLSRHFAKWDEMPKRISNVTIVLQENPYAKRTEKLVIGLNSIGKIFDIKHPVTDEKYQMNVLDVTQQEMDWDNVPIGKHGQDMILPSHYLNVTYQMTPQPDVRLFHFMAENGDEPRRNVTSMSTGAVSIIGGSSGLTSVFIAGKKKEPATNSLPSGLFFEPITEAKFTPTFMVAGRDDMEITISLEES